MQELTSAREIIKKLGGLNAVAEITARNPKAITNWRIFNRFPSNTFVAMQRALVELGYTAPPDLWGMVSAEDHQQRAAS